MKKEKNDPLVEIGRALWEGWVKPCYDDFFSTHDKNNKADQDEFNRIMNKIVRENGSWSEGK